MAERLDTFPAPARTTYPSDEWMSGDVWKLKAGADFTSKVPRFRAMAMAQRTKARRDCSPTSAHRA